MPNLSREDFAAFAAAKARENPGRTVVVPLAVTLLDDLLTPVLAYRRLVAPDERTAPSFLFESVEGGERQGRHSILSAQPAIEVVARAAPSAEGGPPMVRITDRRAGTVSESRESDPLAILPRLTADKKLCLPPAPTSSASALPSSFLGGWVGFAAYDTVRYAEPESLPISKAPPDDRNLPDLHFAYYDSVVIFDHVRKTVTITLLVDLEPGATERQAGHAYANAVGWLEFRAKDLQRESRTLASGRIDPRAYSANRPAPAAAASAPVTSNMTEAQHAAMVARALEYIRAGDIFQVVLGQRFEKRSSADPFDVYRALRAVNPSPYMVYLQAEGCILVASSPEILCRVRRAGGAAPGGTGGSPVGAVPSSFTVTNRPLAGTRRRGTTTEEDAALERELLADPKERAEHIMLVDLGRNDVGKVCKPRTVQTPTVMHVERYSHVMHISSTVTGELKGDLTCWDALRAALPVGTISGAPKIRAMQIIDELEPVRRGPYGGGFGYVSLDGEMDIALALRTIVVPTDPPATSPKRERGPDSPAHTTTDSAASPPTPWTYHIQAAGGIVADSNAHDEYMETVNKSAALARAVELAEHAFKG